MGMGVPVKIAQTRDSSDILFVESERSNATWSFCLLSVLKELCLIKHSVLDIELDWRDRSGSTDSMSVRNSER